MTEEFKSVDTPHYHVWTDALHARELARKTVDRWNRGSYVRWTIISACTALEIACEAYFGQPVGRRFKEDVDTACDAAGISRPTWGQGLWQRVLVVRGWRTDYVHVALAQARLFAPVSEAEEAIDVVRHAVLDIAGRTGHGAPSWVQDDRDMADGESSGKPPSVMGHLSVSQLGSGGPDGIRICYVYADKEHDSQFLAPDPNFDPVPVLEAQVKAMQLPVSAVRAYRGSTLLKEIVVNMRGS